MDTQRTLIGSSDKQLALLREVISSAFEVAPMPIALRRSAVRLTWEVPDDLLLTWARECGVDYEAIPGCCPGLADYFRSDIGKQVVAQHLKTRRMRPMARGLRRVVATVLRFVRGGKLPIDAEIIMESVMALGTGRCTPWGSRFLSGAADVLGVQPQPDCLLERYAQALEETDHQRLLDTRRAIGVGHFAEWMQNRFRELKRWLRDSSGPRIRWEVNTLPHNGGIYELLLKGGKK